jgi:hypothetical protein
MIPCGVYTLSENTDRVGTVNSLPIDFYFIAIDRIEEKGPESNFTSGQDALLAITPGSTYFWRLPNGMDP